MYQPAAIMQTKIFATVPEAMHWKGDVTQWFAAPSRDQWGRTGSLPGSFLESPNFDRAGILHCVDIPYGRILRVNASGQFEVVYQYDGEPNALRFHRDGRIFIADAKRGILLLDPTNWKLEPFVTRANYEGLRGPNDLVFAPNGDLYFTDPGQSDLINPTGRVVHVRPDGQAKIILDRIPGPNGLVLNDSGTMLYLAVTRTNSVWQLNLRSDATVSKAGVFVQMSGGMGPDGLTMDSKGNLLVAHAGGACVWVFDPYGEPLYRLKSCAGRVMTNLTYSPADPHMLYMTEATSGSKSVAKKADTMNAELSATSAYSKLDQKQVTSWLDLRNKAAHGKYTEYSKAQVVLMHQGILEFMTRVHS